jgi:hypothetical protein
MKVLNIDKIVLGTASLDESINICFGCEALRYVHGPNVVIGPWQDNKRSLLFDFKLLGALPGCLKHLSRLMNVRCEQTREYVGSNTFKLTNKIHHLLSSVVNIVSEFVLEYDEERNQTSLHGKVTHKCYMLPYLNQVVESFAMHQSTSVVKSFELFLRSKF